MSMAVLLPDKEADDMDRKCLSEIETEWVGETNLIEAKKRQNYIAISVGSITHNSNLDSL
jgi:hypothetical protein